MNTIELATKLIAHQSITPNDNNCQQLIANYLTNSGFIVQHLPYGDVSNLWATHGNGKPYMVFAGHTDVVPPGNDAAWSTPAFEPTIKDGFLYGRGAVDMKGGLAAMLVAAKNFVEKNPKHLGTIGFLLTSDEEGEAINGTKKVVEYLQDQNIMIDYCLLGEPSSETKVGDTVKIGRRGSIVATIKIFGVQGHVAYPEQVKNPVTAALPILMQLQRHQWEQITNTCFPPTTVQITKLHADSPASNVTPHELSCQLAIRFSPEITAAEIKTEIESILTTQPLKFELNWQLHAEPFITKPGLLLKAAQQAIKMVTGQTTQISTGGGTSDGRFIASMGTQIVELGPINATMHKVNECVACEDLEVLTVMYEQILVEVLG